MVGRPVHLVLALAMVCMFQGEPVCAQTSLPAGFTLQDRVTGLDSPVAIAFAGDGRMFIAEQRGTVRVFENGALRPQFFLDLRNEVQGSGWRGMLGLTLDPDFLNNRHVYVAYVVDPSFGEPDEPEDVPSFCRVTRYTGTAASDGNIADLSSRLVLIGSIPSQGFPACFAHTVDSVRFGADGSLLISAGDGGHYDFVDGGGNDPTCFQPPLFNSDQDIGAFRSQYLNSISGKILRVDPQTGLGLPSNPHWTGDAAAAKSRVWVNGLRNPYRFCVRPGTGSSSSPGTLYIGDVGWYNLEEISISKVGGENFGWPCREGMQWTLEYPPLNPPNGGCDTIETPVNPGPRIDPLVQWHHHDPLVSVPDPITGRSVTGGDFYTGTSYPLAYRGAYFFADWWAGWVRVLRTNQNDEYVNSFGFGGTIQEIVDIVPDPVSGDLHIISRSQGKVLRLRYDGPGVGDINGDDIVNVDDLLILLQGWGPCDGGPQKCPADINGDRITNVDDLLALLQNWG